MKIDAYDNKTYVILEASRPQFLQNSVNDFISKEFKENRIWKPHGDIVLKPITNDWLQVLTRVIEKE